MGVSGLAGIGHGVCEEGEELLAGDHDAPPELDMRDGALVDARGDRAGIDAEGFGGFLAGDDEAAPLTEVVHVEGALPQLSTSGISKLEAGDRRVDVDDLTVIAYLLRTTPAALLTPPDEQTTLTGVPEGYEPEEIDRWMRGELVLTDEGLFNYWQQEWVICTDRIHHLETTLAGMTAPRKDDPEKPSAHPKTIAAYQERLEAARARARVIQERGVQLDPEGRVFNAADYAENYSNTHRPGQTTARRTLS